MAQSLRTLTFYLHATDKQHWLDHVTSDCNLRMSYTETGTHFHSLSDKGQGEDAPILIVSAIYVFSELTEMVMNTKSSYKK